MKNQSPNAREWPVYTHSGRSGDSGELPLTTQVVKKVKTAMAGGKTMRISVSNTMTVER